MEELKASPGPDGQADIQSPGDAQSYMLSTGCLEFHIRRPRIEMEMEPVLLAISLEPNLTDKTGEYVA